MTHVRFTIRLLRWVGAAVVGAAVIAVLLLWRLSMGPLELHFARAYANRTFDTSEGRMALEARRVSLVWGGWQEPLQLVLADIAATDAKGMRVATVPAVVINLSFNALIGGALQPTEIDIDNVRVDVVITREGLIETFLPQDDDASSSRILPILLEQLLKEPDVNHPLGRLNQVRISSAHVRVDDKTTGFVWDAPAARALMVRDEAGVRMQGALTVQAGGHNAEFQLSALYGRSREQLDISLRGQNLRLSAFASAAPQLAPLADLDMPMDGAIRVSASGKGEIRNVDLDLRGGPGRIGIPGVLSPARDVDRATLRLSFTPAENRVRVEEFSVGFNGPTASLRGLLELKQRDFRFEGSAELKDVPVPRLAEFWLEPLAAGGRAWTMANISDGMVNAITLDFAVGGNLDHPENLKVERSLAQMRYEGLTVRYLDPMPPLRGVSGTMRFDGALMRFDIASGAVGNIKLAGGRVDVLGLEGGDNHRTEIELQIRSSVPDTMAFLEHPKIGLAKDLLFNPKRTAGDVAVTLRLKLPLLKSVAMSDVSYWAGADIERFALQNAALGLNLTDATARLEVDARELKVTGKGKVEGQVLDVQWRELFGPKPAFRRRYEVKGQISQATLAKAGLAGLEPYMSGSVILAPLVYKVPVAGPSELSIKADLKPTRLEIPDIKWEKAVGSDGQLTASARFAGGPVPASTDFDLRAGDLSVAGKIELRATDGQFQRATLSRVTLGRTNISGEVRRTDTGYAIDARGPALDVARFLEDEKQAPRPPDPNAPAQPLSGPVMAISLDIGQVLLKRGALPAVKGVLTRQGERLLTTDLQLAASSAGPTKLTLKAQGNGRHLDVKSPDVGGLLRAAGWLDGLVGGELGITAQFDDSKADPPMTINVEMKKFRLAQTAPTRDRDVGTLNDVIEQLGRAGNAGQVFDKLEARIDKAGARMTIRDGRTSGNSVGITAQGTYQFDRDEICLAGAVTPAYVLNAFLSNVPVLGWILTGGEGRGMFAINYSLRGPIDNPKGEVNAATAITPGFLRRMMEGTCGVTSGATDQVSAPDERRTLEQQQQERIGH
ncbi:hypothetical protein FHP25_17415 [Vineibacter terrae]|uniref:YhdP central domain-containing protein n=1 Tax=Vineibacter terrae TaxID=2586908 RepID=A0A5C8PLG8_9HYPH|nr:AsmA-like C-terminal domain-containing protein [Vineibacter terrae]TXL74268.1 hypothetical protein FHP25_17415 [Vineibacter terrae]